MKSIVRKSRISWSSKRGSKSSSLDGNQAQPQDDDASILEEGARALPSSYQDAVLVEISLNWTQDEERLVEAFCSIAEEGESKQQLHHETTPSIFMESSMVAATPHPRSQTFRSYPNAISSTAFDSTEFIIAEYSSASMREITADLSRLDEDIEENVSILKSIVKRNVDLYLSAFSILQEVHSFRIKTEPFLVLSSSLKGMDN